MNVYSKINSLLGFEFQKYLIAHPHIADKISPNTLVVFQIDGDDKCNKWNIETSLKEQRERSTDGQDFLKELARRIAFGRFRNF